MTDSVLSLNIILAIAVFLLGLGIGSFLNVVILRYGTGEGLLGRSRCNTCRKIIRWFENIPLLSYLLLRGQCRTCRTRLSLQYPVVELITGILFLAVWLKISLNSGFLILNSNFTDLFTGLILPSLFYFTVFSLLITIFVYDLYHKLIPDLFSYSLAGLTLLGVVVSGLSGGLSSGAASGLSPDFWWQLAAGPLLFLPFWALWYFSRGTWMGLGDGKLALGMGWLLGLSAGLSAVVLAFWLGAGAALIILAWQRLGLQLPTDGGRLGLKSEVPFGPFLVLGTAAQFFLELDLLSLSTLV